MPSRPFRRRNRHRAPHPAGISRASDAGRGRLRAAGYRERAATEPAWRHALSLFGDIKYPADFKRFDYVNPDAPKGGAVRQIAVGTFDNFNPVVSGVKGAIAGQRLGGGSGFLLAVADAVYGSGRWPLDRAAEIGPFVRRTLPDIDDLVTQVESQLRS